ncbi:MAG: ATP-dependent helicase [Caldilineaceae bacterium]|nr:ATP-dependent helicase [Caldilineaceae bacterium]MBP8124632.1 ATP-dependent helicase [Caldilineaceae bacterium]MBP9074009.1 ATP-dependent helicase [Caldilineaceae bacterium]
MTGAFQPRPAQAKILEYTGGPMGISAVPGSGKTFTLSLLAARLVERMAEQAVGGGFAGEREVLVVTFTNSAVENFRARIGQFVQQEQGLLPGVGYRVRTLHGLAHDILRERPSLVGLAEGFDIVDDRTAAAIKRDAVIGYLNSHPDAFGPFILPEFLQNPKRIEKALMADAIDIADRVIRTAKELRLGPVQFQTALMRQSGTWPLLEFAGEIYTIYQRSLHVRGGVDFDDLIVLALQALDADPAYLSRLQDRWPYILEDEAQDSGLLQEEMLRRLTARHTNWVRVGDPNQAINTTFTSADQKFLRRFIQKYPQQSQPLPNSGRSAQPIIDRANFLAEWSRRAHPVLHPDQHLMPPEILPTPPGDPQPNPAPGDVPFMVYDRALSPEEEVDVLVKSLARWLPKNQDQTVAVLAPDNNRGFAITQALELAKLPFDDSLLRSDSATRAAAKALAITLAYITRPQVPNFLESLWIEVWWGRRGLGIRDWGLGSGGEEEIGRQGDNLPISQSPNPQSPIPDPVQTFGRALGKLGQPEQFVFPKAGEDWLDSLSWLDEAEGFRAVAEAFRGDLQRWTRTTELPVDELVLILGADLFTEPADLALTHHLAVLLAKLGRENPAWRLPELAGEMENIAQNRRRVQSFSDDAFGFVPKPGMITVSTMHSAKGLEWDRVYLVSLNDYSFPSGGDDESYRGERWYVRDSLNLVAEAIDQTRMLQMGTLDEYAPGIATRQARQEIGGERLRLLYVGITRARREVILTYNTGRNPNNTLNGPALAFEALAAFGIGD